MIKMSIYKNQMTLQYEIALIEVRENGDRYFAKPVNIVFETSPLSEGSICQPTFSVDCEVFDFAVEQMSELTSRQLLDQKEKDKNRNIDQLERIINTLIERK
jgi:hypothetical protein